MRVRSAEVLAETLRLTRELRGISQAEVGRRVGKSRQYIGQLASGETATCTEEVATGIAATLDVDVAALFLPDESGETGDVVQSRREVAA